jgi:hypothetical protein
MSLEKINGYEKEPENRKFGKENIKQWNRESEDFQYAKSKVLKNGRVQEEITKRIKAVRKFYILVNSYILGEGNAKGNKNAFI